MARFTKQQRPNPARIQATRVAAARVQVASATAAVEEQVEAVEAGVPADLADQLNDLRGRVEALEN